MSEIKEGPSYLLRMEILEEIEKDRKTKLLLEYIISLRKDIEVLKYQIDMHINAPIIF